MVQIAPSILSADFLNLRKDVQFVNEHADLFHLDIMDGSFVPNLSFGFPVVEAIAKEAKKPLDTHLMIVHPDRYVERFAEAGSAMISFHLDASEQGGEDPARTLAHIRACGARAGLAINPDIPVERLFPFLEEADFFLIMSVFAGFGGQKFIESSCGRIADLRAEMLRRGLRKDIEVDGGVSPANAAALVRAGAAILVAGSAVFRAPDPAAALAALRG